MDQSLQDVLFRPAGGLQKAKTTKIKTFLLLEPLAGGSSTKIFRVLKQKLESWVKNTKAA